MSDEVVVAGTIGGAEGGNSGTSLPSPSKSVTTLNATMTMSQQRRLEIDTLAYAKAQNITDLVRDALFRYLDSEENRSVIDTILQARSQAQRRNVA